MESKIDDTILVGCFTSDFFFAGWLSMASNIELVMLLGSCFEEAVVVVMVERLPRPDPTLLPLTDALGLGAESRLKSEREKISGQVI